MANFQVQREYTIVENAVLEDKTLPSDAKLVYVYLLKYVHDYAFNKSEYWLSIETLAENSRISKRQVIRMLKVLKKKGYIPAMDQGVNNIG